MNVTLRVATLYNCDSLRFRARTSDPHTLDPMWRETMLGCIILDLLRDMYQFDMTYVFDNPERNVTVEGLNNASQSYRDMVDVYSRSMTLTQELAEQIYPIHALHTWKLGFLLSRPSNKIFSTFYSKPFSRPVWNCLYGMGLLIIIFFYILKRWEFSVLGGWQNSIAYEALLVVGAYCQHIPPIDPRLPSRRIAYLIFFTFVYIVYTYYTSNLLSNLVNDKDHGIDLHTLADSDYLFLAVNQMMMAIFERPQIYHYNRNISLVVKKLMRIRSVSISDGLQAVKTGKYALLSDFITVYPLMKRTYDNDDICKLVSIDLLSGITKYFYTSKKFPYKEQFKIGFLRIKEAGLLNRLVCTDFEEPKCTKSHIIQISMQHIAIPLTILAVSSVVSVIIMVAERIHYNRNIVWPYFN
uniref:Ionotropic glutamate receptor C-terminal domain-containing protein n=1 Tax=Heliothis virescens TaxID=7102 RepID=A0A2A4JYJ6_HELVI